MRKEEGELGISRESQERTNSPGFERGSCLRCCIIKPGGFDEEGRGGPRRRRRENVRCLMRGDCGPLYQGRFRHCLFRFLKRERLFSSSEEERLGARGSVRERDNALTFVVYSFEVRKRPTLLTLHHHYHGYGRLNGSEIEGDIYVMMRDTISYCTVLCCTELRSQNQHTSIVVQIQLQLPIGVEVFNL